MSYLIPYDRDIFNKKSNHGNPSRARMGLCSYCRKNRSAEFILVTNTHAHWALCNLHARLWRMKTDMAKIRSIFDQPELEQALNLAIPYIEV